MPNIGRPRLVAPVGQSFNHLTVLGAAGLRSDGHSLWRCLCRCGETKVLASNAVKLGATKSCGCLKVRHGLWRTPEYAIWMGMRNRCAWNPYYKGRGIRVSPIWDDFAVFLRDMGRRPSKRHTLDRIDTRGHYEPGNVRWATYREQMRNQTKNRHITFGGETMILADWAARLGLRTPNLLWRLKNWTREQALTLPAGTRLRKTGPKPHGVTRRSFTR